MKPSKKIRGLLAAVMLSFLITACTKNNSSDTKDTKTATQSIEVAKKEEIEKALTDKNSIVLDARKNDAYIGWTIDGVKRGGHIKGAVDFSANWLTSEYDEKENLEKRTREEVLDIAIKDKNITSEKEVIVYDTNDKDAKSVAEYLSKKGIKKIKTYNATEWINDENKVLESYPNYQLLLSPTIVKDIIDGKRPDGFPKDKNIKIVNVSWGNLEESGYLKGHIPTAIHINTDSFEPPKENKNGDMEWKLAEDSILEKLLLDNGITSNDIVIATSPEPMAASRFAVICQYMGVKDVRVMNGGLVGWKSYGYELETKENKPTVATEFGVKVPARPELIDTLPEVKETLANKEKSQEFVLVDNRTWEEHIGEVTGYSYHNKKGRIPGSVFGHAGVKNSSSMSFYRNIDKTIRNIDEIKKMWEDDKIDATKHLSFMCGSGWRAAEILWDSQVMGMKNTSLYSDGWIGWSNEGNPTESGTPNK